MKLKNKLITLSMLSLLTLLIMVGGSMSYDDEKTKENYYCDMVKEGTWPAFKENVNCNQN